MADLDTLLQDFSYLKSLEHKNEAPRRVSKKLLLPHHSVEYVVKHIFSETGELNFDRIYRRPIGFRCLRDYWCSEEYVGDHGPRAKLATTLCEAVHDLSAQLPAEALESATELKKNLIDQEAVRALWSEEAVTALDSQLAALTKRVRDIKNKEMNSSRVAEKDDTGAGTSAAAVVAGEVIKMVSIKDMFRAFSDQAKAFLSKDPWQHFLSSKAMRRYCQWKHLELNMKVTVEDFDVHRILGRGGFGEVFPCRKRDTGAVFAMKKLYKKRLKSKNQELAAVHERNVLAEMNSKFVTNLKYAFHDDTTLYLILDLMEGGDLSFHLKRKGTFSVEEARFYAAEVVLGLAHIHSRKLVYRDLKPANILLDEHGHARISDLGLARDVRHGYPTSQCGTVGYMSPEVLQSGVEYGYGCDWWSLGCMIFEFITGVTPFRQVPSTKDEVKDRTLKEEVVFPDDFPAAARDVCERLLHKDPSKRLGAGGVSEIKRHPFFDDVDWLALADHKVDPLIKPFQGQVNARDVYDIERLNQYETKKVVITAEDNSKYYSTFNHIMSHHWQREVLNSVFDSVSQECNREETKMESRIQTRLTSSRAHTYFNPPSRERVMEGYLRKLGGFMRRAWKKRYVILTQDSIAWLTEPVTNARKVLHFDDVATIDKVQQGRVASCIAIGTTDRIYTFTSEHDSDFQVWITKLLETFHKFKGTEVVTPGPTLVASARSNEAENPSRRSSRSTQEADDEE
ncbi:AGC/GRK/BARK protein kinase [Salpingoeca rosetta]|uniref:G protein-coupled receptor kinase n=1 Tax=Salpingoeca rosetta (strain ATCC 50818 / BSB-021) TaxID=946362 RepID=F2UK45_SALR5|nr:AGC/GRK/BARK protein kinase [Salpingoeca rosetta]EGD77494.1 AGC/GRK/BARK protein kinase [Salpingoeca rosetta]|eukprot:XP_004990382.1 AGC/GRK/BARK protein kinase [Salpingoeca rosetta]